MENLKYLIQKWFAEIFIFFQTQNQFFSYNQLVKCGFLEVGRYTYGVPDVHVFRGSESKVVIGSFCSIAGGVKILTGGIHPAGWVSTYPFRIKWQLPNAYTDGLPTSKGDVVIGSDVWISSDCIILSGVNIGHGSIIASGAVVTKDVAPYAIVGGVPAKLIGWRFDQETIRQLLAIRWWEWSDEAILQAVDLLSSPQIEEFIMAYGQPTTLSASQT
jgi:acetyltransferase-like isoleucine patch superfamily enzyme